jgi:sporulation protein YlmC with PRC-barrel domain
MKSMSVSDNRLFGNRTSMRATVTAVAAACLLALPAASAQQPATPSQTLNRGQTNPLSADELYRGWRASGIIGQPVISKAQQKLGLVRNLVLADNGQVESLLVEGKGAAGLPEFVFKLPWQRVDTSNLPKRIIADITSGELPEYGLFPGKEGVAELPGEFRASQVIGDIARLQAGQGYGYVSDLVFSRNGKLLAIAITRDALGRGGTYAFRYPGTTGRWDPRMSYYGLPYITEEQATEAAIRIDSSRFEGIGG